MILEMLDNILGLPPEGWEWLQYVIGTVILMFMIRSIFTMFELFGLPRNFK